MYRDDLIRAKLGELNMSRVRLAELSDLNINTISALCRGEVVSIATLKKVGDVLSLSMPELFTPKPNTEEAHTNLTPAA